MGKFSLYFCTTQQSYILFILIMTDFSSITMNDTWVENQYSALYTNCVFLKYLTTMFLTSCYNSKKYREFKIRNEGYVLLVLL